MQQQAAITEIPFGNAALNPAAKHRRQPIHKMLVSFSAAYFTGALVTDLVYWQMPNVMWERFSIWLIAAGLALAGFAAVAYAIDLVTGGNIDRPAIPARLATCSPSCSRSSTPSFTAATVTPPSYRWA
jgi:hypothetical protein